MPNDAKQESRPWPASASLVSRASLCVCPKFFFPGVSVVVERSRAGESVAGLSSGGEGGGRGGGGGGGASERGGPRFPVRGEREGEVESGRSTLKISRLESASWPFSESPKPLETRALRRGSPTAVGPRACRVPLERRGDEIEERRMAEKGGESKQHLSCSAFSHEHAIDFFLLPFSFFSFQLPEQVNNQSPLT